MKINMFRIFDNLDLKNTDKLIGKNFQADYDADLTERIKSDTLSKLDILNDNKNSKSVIKRFVSFKKFIAVAAAIAVFCCTLSVGAAVYFKPDSALAEHFTFNDEVDLSTLGQEINLTSTSSGYSITLKQVLSDNSTMHAVFECPQKDGIMLVPGTVDILINGHHYFDGYGYTTYVSKDNVFSAIFNGLRNIKSNDRITIEVTSAAYYDSNSKQYCHDDDIKGKWSYEFKALRANVKTQLEPISTIKASDSEYKIKKFTVSPLGIHIDYKQINGTSSDVTMGINGDQTELTSKGEAFVIVEMKDGTVYSDSLDNNSFDSCIGGTANENLPYKGNIDITFRNVINVDDIKSITVDNNLIYSA